MVGERSVVGVPLRHDDEPLNEGVATLGAGGQGAGNGPLTAEVGEIGSSSPLVSASWISSSSSRSDRSESDCGRAKRGKGVSRLSKRTDPCCTAPGGDDRYGRWVKRYARWGGTWGGNQYNRHASHAIYPGKRALVRSQQTEEGEDETSTAVFGGRGDEKGQKDNPANVSGWRRRGGVWTV